METNENIKSLTETLSSLEEEKYKLINKAVTQGLRDDVTCWNNDVQWIGKIPQHWRALKGKYCFETRNTKGNSISLQLLSPTQKYGVIPQSLYEEYTKMVTVKVNEKTNLQTFKTIHKGDYCISLRSFEGGFEYCDYEGVVSPAYTVLYPIIECDRRFYKYLFKIKPFINEMNSYSLSLRDGKPISFEDFGETLLPVPPIEEQREIAEYLDKKCAEIDDVIGDIKAQIESLSKMRLSMISETITRGLNPNVEYKDSGIVWLGQIPAHWQVLKNKYIFDISKVIVENPENYQLLSLTTKGIREKDENDTGGKVPENYNTYQVVVPNDIVMCLFDLDCSAVFSGLSPYRGMISPAYKILKTKNGVAIPEYMQYVFMHAFSGRHYKQYSKSLRFTVNADEFGTLFTIVPPIEEQREIAEYLDKKCAEIDDVIGDKEKQLGVLEEYKKSLIFEVVTGKRGICNE